jgi:hypothetical protein
MSAVFPFVSVSSPRKRGSSAFDRTTLDSRFRGNDTEAGRRRGDGAAHP